MKRFLISFACLSLLIAAGFSTSRGQPQSPDAKQQMRTKLVHSQGILEGMLAEDYEKVARSSADLGLTAQATAWQVFQTPEYTRNSETFRRTCDDMARHAKAKDLEALMRDYSELTSQCVQCHKYIRGVRVTEVDRPRAALALR